MMRSPSLIGDRSASFGPRPSTRAAQQSRKMQNLAMGAAHGKKTGAVGKKIRELRIDGVFVRTLACRLSCRRMVVSLAAMPRQHSSLSLTRPPAACPKSRRNSPTRRVHRAKAGGACQFLDDGLLPTFLVAASPAACPSAAGRSPARSGAEDPASAARVNCASTSIASRTSGKIAPRFLAPKQANVRGKIRRRAPQSPAQRTISIFFLHALSGQKAPPMQYQVRKVKQTPRSGTIKVR